MKKIRLCHEPKSKRAGTWSSSQGTVTLNLKSGFWYFEHLAKGAIHHELTLMKFRSWPREKQDEWVNKIDQIDPMNNYVASWREHDRTRRESEADGGPHTYSRMLANGGYLDSMERYVREDMPDRAIGTDLRECMKNWNCGRKEIADGTLRKRVEQAAYHVTRRYADEQHSAFIEKMWSDPSTAD